MSKVNLNTGKSKCIDYKKFMKECYQDSLANCERRPRVTKKETLMILEDFRLLLNNIIENVGEDKIALAVLLDTAISELTYVSKEDPFTDFVRNDSDLLAVSDVLYVRADEGTLIGDDKMCIALDFARAQGILGCGLLWEGSPAFISKLENYYGEYTGNRIFLDDLITSFIPLWKKYKEIFMRYAYKG